MNDSKKRCIISVESDVLARVNEFAKTGKVSQGDVVGIMLDMVSTDRMIAAMAEVKATKVDGRVNNGSFVKKLSKLAPEKRAIVEQLLAEVEGKN